MATALQRQLAKQTASFPNPYDLKAQRQSHGQSLLHEPAIASKEDFDTIYDRCSEAFQRISAIDDRLLPFQNTLFSEQSKRQDRTQLTATQNKTLDSLIHSFLSLISGRLHLQPAIVAVEWLVRRFRAHHMNTSALLFAFLPYHANPSFSTIFQRLLTILPSKLPDTFRFLDLNRRDLIEQQKTSDPHSARPTILTSTSQIVHAATINPTFSTAFNEFTLDACRRGQDFEGMIKLWGETTSQALAGQLDVEGTRKEGREAKEEDVVRRALTILDSGLRIQRSRSLRLACYTLIFVLVSRVHLADRTVVPLLNAVWHPFNKASSLPEQEDLTCLLMLSLHAESSLPKNICHRLLQSPKLINQLSDLGQIYDTTAFILSLFRYACSELYKMPANMQFIQQVISSPMIHGESLARAVTFALTMINDHDKTLRAEDRQVLTRTLQALAESADSSAPVQRLLSAEGFSDVKGSMALPQRPENESPSDLDQESDFDIALSTMSSASNSSDMTTCLSTCSSPIYERLARIALLAGTSTERWSRLSRLNIFQGSSGKILYVSFLLRICSSSRTSATKAASLTELINIVRQHKGNDFQILLPYIITCFNDASPVVRKTAAACLVELQASAQQTGSSQSPFARDRLYDKEPASFLKPAQIASLYELLIQHIEEYRLDATQISRVLREVLTARKLTKGPDREAVLHFLSAAIEVAPLANIRIRLLKLLEGLPSVGNTSVTNTLLPLIRRDIKENNHLTKELVLGSVTEVEYWTCLFGAISASSLDGIKVLKEAISDQSASSGLRVAAIIHAKKIWPVEKPKKQADLAEALLRCVYEVNDSSSTDVMDAATDVLRTARFSAPALLAIISSLPSLDEVARDEQRSRKKQKTATGHVGNNGAVSVVLAQWTFVLDIVRSSEDRGDIDLVARISQMLSELHPLEAELGNQAHFVEAFLLESVSDAIKDLYKKAPGQMGSSLASVDTVIEIFQTSSSTQVQRASLALISTLASVFPDAIMHHIMPIFTHMGQSILKHGDEFSVHVADQAVKSIVPPLLESFRKQKSGMQEGMVRVLLSFVVAYDHIPYERRLPLFASLVGQLGVEDTLHLLALLFVDKHGRSRGAVNLIAELLSRYDAIIQLEALSKSIAIIQDACQMHPASLTSQIIPSKDRKVRMQSAANFLALACRIVQHAEMAQGVESVLLKSNAQSDRFRKLSSEMMERTLQLGSLLQNEKKLAIGSSQLLDMILKLTPVHETINSLESILRRKDTTVQCQVLKSIEERVGSIRVGDAPAQHACLNLLTRLEEALHNSKDVKLVQTAISCADTIIERFGKKGPEQALSLLRTLVSEKFISAGNDNVKVLTFFCLATAVQTLGEQVVPVLPQTLRLGFETTKQCISEANIPVYNASLAAYAATLDHLSDFVTKAQLVQLLEICAMAASSDKLRAQTLENRTSTLDLLAKRPDEPHVRDCISALSTTWSRTAGRGIDAMLEHVRVFEVLVSVMPKKTAARLSQSLLDLFLQIIGTSSQSPKIGPIADELEELERMEEQASKVMVKIIYKLNDTAFRPLFLRMLDWVNEGTDRQRSVARRASLYRFLYEFFGTLKSIVTSYSGLILEDAIAILHGGFSGDKHERVLWKRLVRTLHEAFEHDQDEYFQAPARFGALSGPLVEQLERAEKLGDDLDACLIPCIVAFASAADSSENQKSMNQAVLAHLRSERTQIRMATVKCQRRLTETLSDEWLAHLPEMLPFIGEALEDDDEDVQNETRAWVSRIEAIIGESLTSMLQ